MSLEWEEKTGVSVRRRPSLSKKPKSMQETERILQDKSPRQSFAARRRQNEDEIRFFRGYVPRKKHGSARKRARSARATQRAASPRKNACIFEKRVEVSRHAETAARWAAVFLESVPFAGETDCHASVRTGSQGQLCAKQLFCNRPFFAE